VKTVVKAFAKVPVAATDFPQGLLPRIFIAPPLREVL